jgi:hypothetical protein
MPRGDLWMSNTVTRKACFISMGRYIRTHLQCLMSAICKIESTEEDHPESDERSPSTGVDAAVCHELLQRPSVEVVPILILYCMNSIALALQLQLRHLHWLVCAVDGRFAFMCALGVNTSRGVEALLHLSENISIWMMLARITYSGEQYQLIY